MNQAMEDAANESGEQKTSSDEPQPETQNDVTADPINTPMDSIEVDLSNI